MNLHLLHHWLVSLRGGEKVLEQFCALFPEAPVHTLVCTDDDNALSKTVTRHQINTTFLNKMPGAVRHYKSMLPLFPAAIKNHRVDADFILSSDASLIKGMKNVNDAPHVCYCHSPPRYLWDMQDDYLKSLSPVKKTIFKMLTPSLRSFDRAAAEQVDHFIANSAFVQQRIQQVYNRRATVIHPAVNLSTFRWDKTSEDFYLIVAALVPYKNVELAVCAFNKLEHRLVVIGDGSEREKLQAMARGNVEIRGLEPRKTVIDYFERCKAFIFSGVEDFGITPLEAQAAGKPVIAFRKGGVLETVIEEETGLFFDEQTPGALIKTVRHFEENYRQFDPERCRKQAELFGPDRFKKEIKSFLSNLYPTYFEAFEWGW